MCIYFTRKYINDTFIFPTIIIIIFLHIVHDDDDDDDESLRTSFLCFPLNSIFVNLLIINMKTVFTYPNRMDHAFGWTCCS